MLVPSSTLTVVRTATELRRAVDSARALGQRVGFVPTMGALHAGHATLIQAAAADLDAVVVSIFVNPTQFNDASDLKNYPRTEALDFEIARQAGATIAFAPSCDEIYPDGFATTVRPGAIAELLEGEHRPGHFDGMATVVARLLGLVRADVAYFGRKDAQQLAIVEQITRDLAIPTEIRGVDTVREDDGLAMSSRNRRLDRAGRRRALAISRGLFAAQRLADGGERSARTLEAAVLGELAVQHLPVDYVSLVDASTFRPVDALDRPCVLAVACHVGDVRLIDNVRLEPALVVA
ncbi:MAG: pantoate--beta-alanine ligase [Solirubrobacteraceae bacterium]|nr:pantoate--beta-alanine ligase [Solirubrobacteraceae bacterium]